MLEHEERCHFLLSAVDECHEKLPLLLATERVMLVKKSE